MALVLLTALVLHLELLLRTAMCICASPLALKTKVILKPATLSSVSLFQLTEMILQNEPNDNSSCFTTQDRHKMLDLVKTKPQQMFLSGATIR